VLLEGVERCTPHLAALIVQFDAARVASLKLCKVLYVNRPSGRATKLMLARINTLYEPAVAEDAGALTARVEKRALIVKFFSPAPLARSVERGV
jgi:hypothetical protein